jgi:hypothetical protein
LSPAEHELWRVSATEPDAAGLRTDCWQRRPTAGSGSGTRTGVWNENGHHVFGVRIGSLPSHAEPTWSPGGSRLAILSGSQIEVVTSTGGVLYNQRFPQRHRIVWMNDQHLALGAYGRCQCQAKSLDLATRKLGPGVERWFDQLSPDRKLGLVIPARRRTRRSSSE